MPDHAPNDLRAAEIRTARLVLRQARPKDVDAVVETQTDEPVRRYLGGPRPASEVRAFLDTVGVQAVTAPSGGFIAADKITDEMVGMVALARRSPDLPGHVTQAQDELELTYVLRRQYWGKGLAHEAIRGLLDRAASELSDQPVIAITQTVNESSLRLLGRLGFENVDTFSNHGAEQVLAVASLHIFGQRPT